jgi:hypothetical protein
MGRVSSLGFTALEAGREGTKGCLALICLNGVFDTCGIGGRSTARLTSENRRLPRIYCIVNQTQ